MYDYRVDFILSYSISMWEKRKGKPLKDKGVKGIKSMNNLFKILDEGNIKILPKHDYNKMKPIMIDSLIYKCEDSWNEKKQVCSLDDDLNERQEIINNPNYIKVEGKMEKFRNKYYEFKERPWGGSGWRFKIQDEDIYIPFEDLRMTAWKKHWNKQDLLDYLGIVPFTPSVMINISPDWGCLKKSDKFWTQFSKIEILKSIIDSYMKEQWYDKWTYVIENGGDGNHIQAHIVAHMNPARLKSTESHLRKGNHTQQIKKYAIKDWKGLTSKGMEGIIKGNSVQKTFLRTEEIVKDKLDYLIEEKKPEGHKNKSIIMNGYVSGCL